MKFSIHPVGKAKTIISNPESKHNYFAWPSAVRFDDGRIAVAASGFRLEHVCPFGKSVIAFSEDNGETYTRPAPVIDTVLDDRDAGLCRFGEKGLILTSFNIDKETQRGYLPRAKCEEDRKYILAYLDTYTEEEGREAYGPSFRISHDAGVTFGERFPSPISSPHGPIERKNGEVLWVGRSLGDAGDGRLYAYTIDTETGKMELRGQINTDEILQFAGVFEPYAIELPDGTILCHFRVDSQKYFTLFQTESKDGGRTWSKPRQLLSDAGGAPAHILRHSSGVLLSLYSYRYEPYGIKAMFSLDDGKNWDTDHYIYQNSYPSWDIGYPCTVEMDDGSLLTVFYARPEKGPAVIMQQKWGFEYAEE